MKIDVYSEQYKSAQSSYNPGELGTGSVKSMADLANTVVGAVQKKREQDDEFNYARVYADTMQEADKMKRQYQETADPDNFEQDMETQRQGIQELVSKKSQVFKTPNAQSNFNKIMTAQLEPSYMGSVLDYSYKIQEQKYKDSLADTSDQMKASLLSGSTMMTLPEAMAVTGEQYKSLAKRYNIPKTLVDSEIAKQNTSFVESYAYGMVLKDPYVVRDLMVGNGIEKFQAYKKSIGEDFSMEDFWANDKIRKEYSESEFGAKFTNIANHLDYESRVDLWKLANSEIDRKEKEEQKALALRNSRSEYDLDIQKDAGIQQAKLDGTLPQQLLGVSKVTSADDPRLGSIGAPIVMGKAKPGPLAKGNSFTKQGQDFANAIDGKLRQKGYTTYLTSNLRPGDKGSAHATASATDIQVFKNKQWSEQGLIEAYKTAVTTYGNNMRKGKSLFEVDPERLPYIKAALEKDGVDTSYVNWDQSRKYGAIAKDKGTQHVHFGIVPTADYSKSNTGSATQFTFKTQQGKQRYLQQMAAGKDPQECYDAARKDELEILQAQDNYRITNRLVTAKNPDGTAVDPAYYGRIINTERQALKNDKSLSNEERLRRLKALDNAEQQVPKLQQSYREDTVDFLLKTNQASNSQEAAIIQAKRYGISPENIVTMTNDEAKVKADQLYSKFSGQQAVEYVKSNAVNPATLRQISKNLPDDSKSNMILYSAMSSGALTSQFVGAIQNWDTVHKAIMQDPKTFPTNWKNSVIGEFRKDPMMKNYFTDLAKTRPEEQVKMLDALTSVYAYRMAMGNEGRNSKEIIKDISQNIIGNNYSSATIAHPRLGNTQLNIANNLLGDRGNMHKIQRAASMASKLGISSNHIYIGYDAINYGAQGKVGTALNAVQEQNKKHYVEGIQKTAKLSSSPDGLNGIFTWQDSKGRYAGATIKNKDNQAALQIPYRNMISAYNEAYALKEQWVKGSGSNKYYSLPRSNSGYRAPYGASEADAMDAALEVVLTKKYPWLNKGSYGK